MNTSVAGTLIRGYLDPLFLGATGGTVVGIFFGRAVEGCLAGVALACGLSEYSSSGPYIGHVAHDSDIEELTHTGQCARSLPYMRRGRDSVEGGNLGESTVSRCRQTHRKTS